MHFWTDIHEQAPQICISNDFLNFARTAMRFLNNKCWSLLTRRRVTNDYFWQLTSSSEVNFWDKFSFKNAKSFLQVNFTKINNVAVVEDWTNSKEIWDALSLATSWYDLQVPGERNSMQK